jgi:hypothetical protein
LSAATGVPVHRLETLIAALVSCGVLTRKGSAVGQRLIPTSFPAPRRILGTIIGSRSGGKSMGSWSILTLV